MATTLAARQAANVLRLSSSRSPSLIQRRGLAGASDPHAPPVDFWKDPMRPSKWKAQHFVIISLTGLGLAVYGGCKAYIGAKKKEHVIWQQKMVDTVIRLNQNRGLYITEASVGPKGATLIFAAKEGVAKEEVKKAVPKEVGLLVNQK